MAKRFIDTELFDDSWFMELSKDAKILWMYLITKCDHAGVIDINKKLVEFQTGIKSYETVSKQLKTRLIHLRDNYYFIPKFIEFQYPDFPRSNVKQQQGAIRILESFGLIKEGKLTVSKDLVESYDNDNGNDNEHDIVKEEHKFLDFWDKYHSITGLPKTDKEPAEKHWKKLNTTEHKKAIENIESYYNSINKSYCKKARTYLAEKNFNDEFKKQDTKDDEMSKVWDLVKKAKKTY